MVEIQQPDMVDVPLQPLEALIDELVFAVGRWDGDDVRLSRLQGQDARCRVGQRPNDDTVEMGFLAPVALEALQHGALVGNLLDEFKGAGADGALGDSLVAVFFDGRWADDGTWLLLI